MAEAGAPGRDTGRASGRSGALSGGVAVAFYTLLTVAWTWPLARGITRDVPWDLGDSLLNCWILAWHFHQAGRLLHGDVAALADWWHPNIFHPTQYAIGHSELLVAQAVQGAPVYALTGNLLLTYNLLFLSSFVLAALGGFLLVRSLTRSPWAGLVAGLLYGFALYRVNQGPHLQVLSAQWFPFVLWGLHEWWEHGRWRHALLAGLALAAQNLSNGYYLVYAALWLPPYVMAQVALRGRLREQRAWAGPLVAALIAGVLTAPFLYPYLALRALGQPPRPLAAVVQYSADTQAWLTANDQLRFWGSRLQTLVRPEGDLFPGLVPLVLTVLALVLAARRRWHHPTGQASRPTTAASPTRRVLVALAATITVGHVIAILLALFGGYARLRLGPLTISITDGARLLAGLAISLTLLLVASPRARRILRDEPQQPVVLWVALGALTVWSSFGPVVHVAGRVARTWPSLYAAAYTFVPGADALRVPPRIAMITALAFAVLGGLAVAELGRRRGGRALSAVLAAAFVVESWPAPVPINLRIDPAPLAPLSEPVPPRPSDHPLVRALATLPPDAVLADLPFGSLPYEVWWQYLSAGHWRARINGYSGDMPPGFLALDEMLRPLPARLAGGPEAGDRAALVEEAFAELQRRGVTHVVLHASAWPSREPADALRAMLSTRGASRVSVVGASEIWQLRP